MNLDPHTSDSLGSGVSARTTKIAGTEYLVIRFTKVISATDSTCLVEVSSDLTVWNSGASHTTEVSVSDNSDGITQTVVVRALDAGHRFGKLRVER